MGLKRAKGEMKKKAKKKEYKTYEHIFILYDCAGRENDPDRNKRNVNRYSAPGFGYWNMSLEVHEAKSVTSKTNQLDQN